MEGEVVPTWIKERGRKIMLRDALVEKN